MGTSAHPQHSYSVTNTGHSQGYAQASYDSTGQLAPPGTKPRVTATLWEDEGSLCFQVEAKGVCVARREGT
jgi:enhanced filamentous growth protein 1